MRKFNAGNERAKRDYFTFLKQAKRYEGRSVDTIAKSINRFEAFTDFRDFKAFRAEHAIAFKESLAEQNNAATGEPLSKATVHATLSHLKQFFQWVCQQPGFKSHVRHLHAEYFNLSRKEARVAKTRRAPRFPTKEQVVHVLELMPSDTTIEKRDRALISFILSTGARDGAVISMKLKHVDLEAGCVHQDAREVATKFSKTFTTFFFPVGDYPRQIIADWVKHLREVELWGDDDPLFPSTKVEPGEDRNFRPARITREHWKSAGPVRRVFRTAFEHAGLPTYGPHSLRHTLTRWGQEVCRTAEEFKSWSQNLGHENVLTTFFSYGEVPGYRQGEVIRRLSEPATAFRADAEEVADVIIRRLNLKGN